MQTVDDPSLHLDVLPISSIQLKVQKPDNKPYPEVNDRSIGAELKRKRLSLDWNQGQAGEHLGVSRGTYHAWERNVYTPEVKKRYKINAFLGFDFYEDSNDLASRMVKYRAENNLRQIDLGARLGVSLRAIEKIEQRQESKVGQKTKVSIDQYLKSFQL